MRWEAGATAVAAVLLTSVAVESAASACVAAAQLECPDGSGAAEAESEQMRAELVQTGARVLGSPGPAQPAGPAGFERSAGLAHFLRTRKSAELDTWRRARLIVPIAWFHVAKSGTSIINTFYHTPTICPGFSFANSVNDSSGRWDDSWGSKDEVCRGGFTQSYGTVGTPGYNHQGIGGFTGNAYKMNRGHFVGMFRQPEQRLISQYYSGKSAQPLIGSKGQEIWPYSTNPKLLALREYAEWNGGCIVRQLTTDSLEPYKALPLPTAEDVSVAIKVLQDGFGFVGITDEWVLSVCLFRAMFGGPCLSSDFGDIRPGEESNNSLYDTSELYGWVDVWDGPVYAEAVSLFKATSDLYGVDSRWCSSFCHD